MTLAVGARLGPYEITAPLGAGGMGEVYTARDARLDRTVAIKVLPAQFAADPQFRERFDRSGTMSPEQVEGQEADARSDIFAFGAMVYEMVTGRPAFSGRTRASLVSAILRDEPPPISTLQPVTPVLLDHVVKRCLPKDPEERWQNAADVVRELKWVTEAPSLSAPIATKAAGGNILGWVAAALTGLAVGVAATFGAVYTSGGPGPASHAIRFEVPPPNESPSLAGGGQPMIAVSPDGRHLAFVALQELVLKSTVEMLPNSWTPDGGAIVTRTQSKSRTVHVGILSLSKNPAHSVFEERPFGYSQGSVSPDGRFVAYNSSESGRVEIYVQSFPKPGGGKWQVSKEGGGHLRWRPDGKELFYYALDGRLMAVPVLSSQPFALGTPVALFGARMLSGPTPSLGYRTQFDVARDGRFLMNLPIGDAEAPPINIVLNWAAGLKK